MTNYPINRYEHTWQEWQFWNQTFDDELGKIDIQEIRELLKEEDLMSGYIFAF